MCVPLDCNINYQNPKNNQNNLISAFNKGRSGVTGATTEEDHQTVKPTLQAQST